MEWSFLILGMAALFFLGRIADSLHRLAQAQEQIAQVETLHAMEQANGPSGQARRSAL